jgi:hypothetical protein
MEGLSIVGVLETWRYEADVSDGVLGAGFSNPQREMVLFGFYLDFYATWMLFRYRCAVCKFDFSLTIVEAGIDSAGVTVIDTV